MFVDVLHLNKKTICQILLDDFRRRKTCAKFVPQRLTSCQGFIQTCQDSPSFLDCNFIFSKVKTALKGKRLQDAEDI
jgi:hypothetical protein